MSVDSDSLCLTSGALTPSLIQPPPTGAGTWLEGQDGAVVKLNDALVSSNAESNRVRLAPDTNKQEEGKSRPEGPFRGRFIKRHTIQVSKVGTGEEVSRWRATAMFPGRHGGSGGGGAGTPGERAASRRRRGWGVVGGEGNAGTQHTELTCCFHCTSCLTRPLEEQSTRIL